jgi:6-phosphogluconolactonase
MTRIVSVFGDLDRLSASMAAHIVSLIKKSNCNSMFSFAISGGSTPRTLYKLLGSRYSRELDWSKVHFFLGDERHVPPGNILSNYRMAKETLFDALELPPENIHPVPFHIGKTESDARDYEQELKNFFSHSDRTFDLTLLGMGSDGHTASLFPNSSALDEKERWVVKVSVGVEPHERITITYPVINSSKRVYFLVAGREKAAALKRAFEGEDFHLLPAAGVRDKSNGPHWWVDRGAYSLMKK